MSSGVRAAANGARASSRPAAAGGAGGLDGGIETAARDRRDAARGRNRDHIHVPVTHPMGHEPTRYENRGTGQRAVLVTGAGSGIGSAITERLANDGFSVLGVDLNPDRTAPARRSRPT